MRRIGIFLVLLGMVTSICLTDAVAQNNTGRGALIGGASGAAIGAIAGGGRGAGIGAAIGAGTGAIVGSQRSVRHHYWHHGRCWARLRNGQSRHASNRYCGR